MTQRKAILIYTEDNRFIDGEGWAPMSVRDEYTPVIGGIEVAHDLVEHLYGTQYIGEFADEFEALGAFWLTRAMNGDSLSNITNGVEAIRGDVLSTMMQIEDAYDVAEAENEIIQAAEEMDIDLSDEEFQEFVWAVDLAVDRLNGDRRADLFTAIKKLLANGFSEAERVYGDAIRANNLFHGVASGFDNAVSEIKDTFGEIPDGYQLVVNFNSASGEVSVEFDPDFDTELLDEAA